MWETLFLMVFGQDHEIVYKITENIKFRNIKLGCTVLNTVQYRELKHMVPNSQHIGVAASSAWPSTL
jgi:hypothetical protein